MSKATDALMDELHRLTAQELLDVLKNGIVDGEGNRVPAPASYFAAAIKFLKDNNVTAVITPGSPMHGLLDNLPFPDELSN